MSKRVRDFTLETRAARAKLAGRGEPYYRAIGPALHVGYRKGKRGGVWVVRRYVDGAYVVATVGQADDIADADGKWILSFWQAQERAWAASKAERPIGVYKVKDAIKAYLEELEGRASYNDVRLRLEAYALPALGDVRVDHLTAEALRKWHKALVRAPRRLRTKTGGTPKVRNIDPRGSRCRPRAQGERKQYPRATQGGAQSRLPRRESGQ